MERFRSEVGSKLKRDYTAGMRIVQPAVCAKCRAVITSLVHPFRMEKTHSEHNNPANQQLWDGSSLARARCSRPRSLRALNLRARDQAALHL